MSRKRKSGLQQGLSEIIAKQTAPVERKQTTSASLLEKFREPQSAPVSTKESLPLNESLSSVAPIAFQNESLPFAESLSLNETLIQQSVDLWASIPEVKGHCKLPHAITDHLYKLLDVPERVVYEQLFRLSWGFGKDSCTVSLPTLATRSGLKPTATHAAVARLIKKGTVTKIAATFGKNREQGITYRLPLPEWLPRNERLSLNERLPRNDSNKENNTQKEKHTTQGGVGVGSKFDLEECRRYAEHLRKTEQGITNPGGYATKIYRSGEADSLIEKFISPSPVLDISKCPDCGGKGYYFPDPTKPETVRCKHERLHA
ncbi:MAG: hypothetical protein M3371_01875 [Acidobacteriota bacterium]|nr:hypothetical protein [Acidobacteriota bacterium]